MARRLKVQPTVTYSIPDEDAVGLDRLDEYSTWINTNDEPYDFPIRTKLTPEEIFTPAKVRRENRFDVWCGYDLHLQIYMRFKKRMRAKGVMELANDILTAHGFLVDGTLADWREAFIQICEVQSAEDDKFELLKQRIDETCTTTITHSGMIIKPGNLLGWIYLSILRDHWDKIIYSECGSPQCGRLVPNFGIPTERFKSGRQVNYCGKRCRNEAVEQQRFIKQNEPAAEVVVELYERARKWGDEFPLKERKEYEERLSKLSKLLGAKDNG